MSITKQQYSIIVDIYTQAIDDLLRSTLPDYEDAIKDSKYYSVAVSMLDTKIRDRLRNKLNDLDLYKTIEHIVRDGQTTKTTQSTKSKERTKKRRKSTKN